MGFVGRYSRPEPTLKRVRSDRVCAQSAVIPRKVHTHRTFLCHVINRPCLATSATELRVSTDALICTNFIAELCILFYNLILSNFWGFLLKFVGLLKGMHQHKCRNVTKEEQ